MANIKGNPACFNTSKTTAEYLQQVDPPITSGGGSSAHNISVVGTDSVISYISLAFFSGGPSSGFKPAKIGKTSIKLRYYKQKAFMILTDKQKVELAVWQDEQKQKKGGKRKRGGGNDSGSDGNDSQKKFQDLTSQILALVFSVRDLKLVTEKSIAFKDQQEAPSTNQSILKPPSCATPRKKSSD